MRFLNRPIIYALGITTGVLTGAAVVSFADHEADSDLPERTIPYGGYLDLDGSPVNATLSFNFALFACADPDADCPTPEWVAWGNWNTGAGTWSNGWPAAPSGGEEVLDLPVYSGRFAVDLGSAPMDPLPEHLFLDQTSLFLAVEVEGAALGALQRIGPGPGAIRAYEAGRFDADDVHTTTLTADVVAANDLTGDGTVPPGTIVSFGGASVPEGWLPCDGRAVSRATYAELFAALGTAWGNGSTTTLSGGSTGPDYFNLPDLRGRFLRGVDGAAGRDPDREARTTAAAGGNTGDAVGSVQGHGFAAHTHGYTAFGSLWGVDCCFGAGDGWRSTGAATSTSTGGTETRPTNANVTYIVKI